MGTDDVMGITGEVQWSYSTQTRPIPGTGANYRGPNDRFSGKANAAAASASAH